jgi:hypothetical protein
MLWVDSCGECSDPSHQRCQAGQRYQQGEVIKNEQITFMRKRSEGLWVIFKFYGKTILSGSGFWIRIQIRLS